MTVAKALVAAQTSRFAGLDALLPDAVAPPDGVVLTAALPAGGQVAAALTRTVTGPGAAASLWSAAEQWELHPLVGAAGALGVELLLREWRRVLDLATVADDSSCLVGWPARDAEVSQTLLGHGFVPLSVLAVRPPGAPAAVAPPAGCRIRPVTETDLDAAVDLALLELTHSAMVGSSVVRTDATELKRAAMASRLAAGDPMWLAERDGEPVGLVECWWAEATRHSWLGSRLRPGRWGYLNCLSVLPAHRGRGLGRALAATAHAAMLREPVAGLFLYYSPPNPLASVFWARQGYRPLWTHWEVRPAGALR